MQEPDAMYRWASHRENRISFAAFFFLLKQLHVDNIEDVGFLEPWKEIYQLT